jgi:glycosyltransferase involved in cell wall biosynthesis
VLIRSIGVVVPARNEEKRLPACLKAIRTAACRPGMPPVRIIVVADDSTDDTELVAASAGAEVLPLRARNAGAARAAGFDRLARTSSVPMHELWLATTDADSRVPSYWLDRQLQWRSDGWDAVVGTVVVEDWSEHSDETRKLFAQHYGPSRDGHAHVHGANLGISGTAFCQIGGFPALAVAEDHALVTALSRIGCRIARPGGLPVVTSARRDPRAAHGFGSLLCSLK